MAVLVTKRVKIGAKETDLPLLQKGVEKRQKNVFTLHPCGVQVVWCEALAWPTGRNVRINQSRSKNVVQCINSYLTLDLSDLFLGAAQDEPPKKMEALGIEYVH